MTPGHSLARQPHKPHTHTAGRWKSIINQVYGGKPATTCSITLKMTLEHSLAGRQDEVTERAVKNYEEAIFFNKIKLIDLTMH